MPLHSLLTSEVEGGERAVSGLDSCTKRAINSARHWMSSCVGPRARIAILKKIKIPPAGIHKNSRCRIQVKNCKIINKLSLKSWSPGRGINLGFFETNHKQNRGSDWWSSLTYATKMNQHTTRQHEWCPADDCDGIGILCELPRIKLKVNAGKSMRCKLLKEYELDNSVVYLCVMNLQLFLHSTAS